MTCRKVRKLMPLAAGDDLRPRPAAAFRAHIDACPGCREELGSFRAALARIRGAAKAEAVQDWSEGEWRALMARVTNGTGAVGEAAGGAGFRTLRPRWVAASVLGAAIGLAILSVLFRVPSIQPGKARDRSLPALASSRSPQDKVAITMVSPETGLQVVWFLDRNFDWKGDQE